MSHHDGTPVYDDRNPVKVWHGFSHETEKLDETKLMLPRNGLIPLVYYPEINASVIVIEVSCLIFLSIVLNNCILILYRK